MDSSSGALGSAVNRALEALVPIISAADVPVAVRQKWLERLYEAHAADQMPYIESLADYWGELCVTPELASAWADQMIGITRMALSPDKNVRGHYHGTSACLSALLAAARYADIHSLLAHTDFWHYKQYAAKALAAEGKPDEAIRSTSRTEIATEQPPSVSVAILVQLLYRIPVIMAVHPQTCFHTCVCAHVQAGRTADICQLNTCAPGYTSG